MQKTDAPGVALPADLTGWLPAAQRFIEWLVEFKHWNTPEAWLARGVIWVVVVYSLLRLIRGVLELLVQLKTYWTGLGWKVRRLTEEERAQLNRRQRFARVLSSDLSNMAKVENWNDQFYTDLEAQIEAEGRFYATNFDRIIRRASEGLRRVSSLVRAIESSAEQFLLLIGEPGSGKSIALRHLAHQLAESALTSKAKMVTIPLYVNLKELPSPTSGDPNSDYIKAFVLENVRRGDADTAEYIRDNWAKHRDDGSWLFLFDSFDEIPAVLHSPSGSRAATLYSEAIRQFLSTMGSCRGVVASREFKGPRNFGWHRLRILAMNEDKQALLVANSYLPSERRRMVMQHIATSESTMLQNPMYLTLLCRFVRDANALPRNDQEVLERHIVRLAERDADHVGMKYALTTRQLLQGASTLARLFAEQQDLSLAPTITDIRLALSDSDVPGGSIDNVIGALVDVKIGRSDVPEARIGDRRFTFAHRRYQETLFVQFLAANPDYIAPKRLLTETRWREYAVTFLQTQPVETLQSLIRGAIDLLKEYDKRQSYVAVLPEYGSTAVYHRWDDAIPRLLGLLEEGLAGRPNDVPADLRAAVAAVLMPRWHDGDFMDRRNVLRIAGLLPPELLTEILVETVRGGSHDTLDIALRKTVFLSNIPPELSRWIQRRLSDDTLDAENDSEITRLEALAARLPQSVRAAFIVSNCKRLRRRMILCTIPMFWPNVALLALITVLLDKSVRAARRRAEQVMTEMAVLNAIVAVSACAVVVVGICWRMRGGATIASAVHFTSAIALIYGLVGLVVLAQYSSRASGKHISPRACLKAMVGLSSEMRRPGQVAKGVVFLATGVMFGMMILDISLVGLWGSRGWLTALVVFVVMVAIEPAIIAIRRRRFRQAYSVYAVSKRCPVAVALHATSLRALVDWTKQETLLRSVRDVRSLGRILRCEPLTGIKPKCKHPIRVQFLSEEREFDLREIGARLNHLADRLTKAGRP
ncbi:MAG TPA: NACHT domain-containing protein [Thermoanaerobaculia bacterium]|nr:NACHT domain-containing protein [Thermoanaerobaculia bacterium]